MNSSALSALNFSFRVRLPIILQSESAECGIACLAMVASYFGYETDLVSIRKRFSLSSHGLNLNQLIGVANKIHLAARPVKVTDNFVDKLKVPCILHWDLNHFVVLKKVSKGNYIIHDPAIGIRTLSLTDFNRHFTGIAVEFTPTSEFKKEEVKQPLKLGHFLTNVKGIRRSLATVFALTLVLQVFAVISPFYMQLVVDNVLEHMDTSLLTALAIGFGLLVIVEACVSFLRGLVMLVFSMSLSVCMSNSLYRHLIRLPMDYFIKRDMGDILSRVGSLERIREFITSSLVGAAIDGLMLIFTLAVMLYYSISLTIVVVFVLLIFVLLRYFLYQPIKQLSLESLIADAKMNTHNMESLRAIQTIKIFQKENSRQIEWQNKLANVLNKSIRTTQWNMGFGFANHILFGLEGVIIVYLGTLAVMDNTLSLGMFFAFLGYKQRFVASINQLIDAVVNFKLLSVHLDRLADIAFAKADDTDSYIDASFDAQLNSETPIPFKIKGRIEVKNLSYRYGENEPYVFSNLNFSIQQGECVVIVGPSGSGKTTLLKCLMGLLEPTSGEILIDGVPLSNVSSYRSQICGVMQEDQLLSGNLIDNIACFSTQIDLVRVHEAARKARIYDEIMAMPMQFQTLIGDMGGGISGGQKQRIILARALYRNPMILFMDEATSHLDVTNESMISANIKALNVTRILVAHRPETIASADREICIS